MRKQEVDNGNDPVGRENEWLGDTDLFIYLFIILAAQTRNRIMKK